MKSFKSPLVLVILLVIGGIFGSFIGQTLGKYLSFLEIGQTVSLQPTTINLVILTITFGCTLKLNIASVIGFFIALFIYNRL